MKYVNTQADGFSERMAEIPNSELPEDLNVLKRMTTYKTNTEDLQWSCKPVQGAECIGWSDLGLYPATSEWHGMAWASDVSPHACSEAAGRLIVLF